MKRKKSIIMQFIVFDSIKSFIKIRPKFCEFFLKIYAVIGACVQSEIDPTFHSDIYKTKNIICLHSKINKCWMNALFSATIFFFCGRSASLKKTFPFKGDDCTNIARRYSFPYVLQAIQTSWEKTFYQNKWPIQEWNNVHFSTLSKIACLVVFS